MRTPGYTLIEALAVVTLLAFAATLLTPLVAGASPAAVLDGAVHGFLDLDAGARLRAQDGDGASLVQEIEGNWLCVAGSNYSDDRATPWRPGGSVRIELRDLRGEELDLIEYDAAGRSRDFTLIVKLEDMSRRVRIAGLTGWSERLP